MVEDIIKAINNDLTVMGGLVLITLLLRPVFLKWLDNIQEGIQVQRSTQAVLSGLDRKIEADHIATKALIDSVNATVGAVRDFKLEMVSVSAAWQSSTKAFDNKLNAVHTDLLTIPAETERVLNGLFKQVPQNTDSIIAPKLAGIKAALETRIAELETRLNAALDPGAHNARQIIMGNLEETRLTLEAMLNRLADIESTLNKLVPPPDPPLGPVALVVPTEDPEDETEDEPNEGEALKPAA